MPRTTRFLDGALELLQPERGYRFAADAPILADFVRPRPGDQLVEIGAGCGVIPLILFVKKKFRRIDAVEIQPELAACARANVRRHGAGDAIRIVEADVRTLDPAAVDAPVDAVFANPPYRRVGAGLLNPDAGRAAARHELTLDLPALFAAARRFLGPAGRFDLVHLWERRGETAAAAAAAGFHLARRREVLPFPDSRRPRLLLTSWAPAAPPGGPVAEPPLAVHERPGVYTAAFRRIISAAPDPADA
jgi:tRNA1Val (adenine37-N6)-methyltransferase